MFVNLFLIVKIVESLLLILKSFPLPKLKNRNSMSLIKETVTSCILLGDLNDFQTKTSSNLRINNKLKIKCLIPMVRYRLSLVRSLKRKV